MKNLPYCNLIEIEIKKVLATKNGNMKMFNIWYLITSICIAVSCKGKPKFSYEILDPQADISELGFSKNSDFEPGIVYPLEYQRKGDSIMTSIYIYAIAGSCTGRTIEPEILDRNDSLILSFQFKKKYMNEVCGLINFIKLNYLLTTKSSGVYFKFPDKI